MSRHTPRRLSDALGPAIVAESETAAFLLGLDLAAGAADVRDQLALALVESATRLKRIGRDGLRIERRLES